MIFGVVGHHSTKKPVVEIQESDRKDALPLVQMFEPERTSLEDLQTANEKDAFVCLEKNGVPVLDDNLTLFRDEQTGSFAAVHGHIFNIHDLVSQYISGEEISDSTDIAEIVFNLFQKFGTKAFGILNGGFIIALWDQRSHRFWLIRDHLGIEPVYYAYQNNVLYFSSRLKSLTRIAAVGKSLNHGVLQRYLLFNYNPGYETLFSNVSSLRPGSCLRVWQQKAEMEPYWRPVFSHVSKKTDAEYKSELIELMHDAVKIRLHGYDFRPGAFLSGGMDSSSVVHFMRQSIPQRFSTFSFRCRGKSYDESYYAKVMSENYNTKHHQIEYTAQDAQDKIAQIAAAEQEPFSDIGIEVASFLLGTYVRQHADYVLTGDGGDELFGGHPVYLADRVAQRFDKIPSFIRTPLTKTLQLLPDTESKKSLIVKAKRFSYSSTFPAELHSNRWRIYYTGDELKMLCQPPVTQSVNGFDPYEGLLRIYNEADGPDELSQTLYGDYYSVVGFYLRRMELIRHFGIEGRMPLLDYRLVDYTARIPSDLKIDKKGNTKILLHQVMTGELPDEIVFRTDKLGHSVPMKNWMRESPSIRELFYEYLSEDSLKRRGLFAPAYVDRLKKEHFRRAHNHSHRLWGLLLFELWCRAHLDES